jgi:hypothetical protein
LGTLKWDFIKKILKKLGIVLYSIEMISRKICFGKWRKGGGGFMKKGIVCKCSPNQFISCNNITPGMGWGLA